MLKVVTLLMSASLLVLVVSSYINMPATEATSRAVSVTDAADDQPRSGKERDRFAILVDGLMELSGLAKAPPVTDILSDDWESWPNSSMFEDLSTSEGLRVSTVESLTDRHTPCVAWLTSPEEFVLIAAIDDMQREAFVVLDKQRSRWMSLESIETRLGGEVLHASGLKPPAEKPLRVPFGFADVGQVPAADEVRVDVPIRNVSMNVVAIEQWRTSCGCTSILSSPESLRPGEWGRLSIEVNAKKSDQEDEFAQSLQLQLQLSDDQLATQIIPIRGRLFRGLSIVPVSIAVGELSGDRSVRMFESYIKSPVPSEVQVTPVSLEDGLSLAAKGVDSASSQVVLTWEFRPDEIARGYNNSLITSALLRVVYPRHDGTSVVEDLPFVIHAQDTPSLQVSPRGLFFGRLAAGESWTGKLRVRSSVESESSTECASLDERDLKFEVDTDQVTVKFTAPPVIGFYETSILVTSGSYSSRVPLTGFIDGSRPE